MDYFTLGKTDIRVSRLAMGCYFKTKWKSDEESGFLNLIKAALDSGITFFDTAESYGGGRSEEVLAEAFSGMRHDVVIATKFGHNHAKPEALRKSAEQSLRRLQTDYIDLLYYHWPSPKIPLDDTLGEMLRLKQEGKIRAIGVSNWNEPEWEECGDRGSIDALQPCYSLLWRHIEKTVLQICRESDIGVVPYSPLCQGILAGRYKDLSSLPDDPFRSNLLLTDERFSDCLKIVSELEVIGSRYGKSPSQVALAWLLGNKAQLCPVIGFSKVEQLHENLGALTFQLPEQEVARLDEISWPLSQDLKPYDTLWGWHSRLTKR